MLAALEDGVRGGQGYSLMDKVYALTTLEAAWKRVERNGGSHGVDRMSVERFAQHPQRYLGELHEALNRGTYRPQPVRRVYLPKGAGGSRPLGIPAVKDRGVQAALKRVREPIFEREFAEHSYGFRPKRGCKEALRAVDESLKAGWGWGVEVDLKSDFDVASSCPPFMVMVRRGRDRPVSP
jgi:RNA-directed DNA polymerase